MNQQSRHRPPTQQLSERADIFMVQNEAAVSIAVGKLMQHTHNDLKVFGLDCEWDLVTKKGQIHKPDILQIGTVQGFCAIFRLHLLNSIPPELRGFLEDPYFLKVGVGVIEDCNKLKQSFDVNTTGAVDVRFLADELNILPRGLSHLCQSVLGVDLTKHHHSFHYWTGRLSELQKQYAALDAIYPARLFYKLSHQRLSEVYSDEWRNWPQDEYHKRTLAMWDKYVGMPFDFMRCKYYYNSLIEMMLTYNDLTPNVELVEQWNADVKGGNTYPGKVVTESLKSPELKQKPAFKAKFASNKSEERKRRKEERLKRIPLRFFRSMVRRLEKEGVDPRTIPTEVVPLSMLGPDGMLDMTKIGELFKTD